MKLEKIIDKQNAADSATENIFADNDKNWLKRSVNDLELESVQAIRRAASTITAGLGLTTYVLNKTLDEDQKNEIVKNSKLITLSLNILIIVY